MCTLYGIYGNTQTIASCCCFFSWTNEDQDDVISVLKLSDETNHKTKNQEASYKEIKVPSVYDSLQLRTSAQSYIEVTVSHTMKNIRQLI